MYQYAENRAPSAQIAHGICNSCDGYTYNKDIIRELSVYKLAAPALLFRYAGAMLTFMPA